MEVALVVAIAALALVGLAAGRVWSLGLPFVVVPLIYVGLAQRWWGSGLGDGWEFAFGLVLAVAVAAAALGLATRSVARHR